MSLRPTEIVTPTFEARTSMDGGSLRLVISGAADGSVLDALGTYLVALHERIVAAKVETVLVDVRGLTFISSLCLVRFITWVSSAQESEPRYTICFKTVAGAKGQERSLRPLLAVGPDVLAIEAV